MPFKKVEKDQRIVATGHNRKRTEEISHQEIKVSANTH